ncbi:hypothetical protein FHS23_000239 [Prauserella isguenensis]|uniref:Uncharacterized protein n=1 Tax=Prauserella isguenensis TaxID=1470180 RepID=A0A839RVZ4_9PSEU|nr:hypothetical protein [Prauserella isguenensis]
MSIFGQVWVFSAIAFVLGAFLAWVFLVRPARKQIRSLEERLVAREADLRRISEPALGAAGTAQTRTERSDPFSDADEALAGTGAHGSSADVDVPDRPEPETSWLERDSLGGYAGGGYAGGGYEDDFDLADRPEDLEVPGDRGAHDADYDAGYADGYRAFAPADEGHERYDDYGRPGPDATGDADDADDADDRGDYTRPGYDDTGYGDTGYGDTGYGDTGYGEHPDDRTRYVAADAGADEDAPVSSVLDPDEMRSVPDTADAADPNLADAESTRFIGTDSLPGAGEVADAAAPERTAGPEERDADPAGGEAGTSAAAGSALHLGAPFQPVTSFDATTELPVDSLRESGLDDPAGRSGGADPAAPADLADPAVGDQDDAGDQARHRAERPGSLFDPAPVGDDEAAAADPNVDRSDADTASAPETSTGDPVAAEAGGPASNGAGELPADPPAYAFGGPDAGPDEGPAESTNVLPKRTPRQRPPGGFDAPKPIQPSMRAITRREPDAAAQSGSLFEPPSPGESPSSEPAAEPAAEAGKHAGQPPSGAQQPTKFVTPAGQVPTGDEAVSGELGASETATAAEGASVENVAERADQADADAPKPGPFGPGSAMPLPGGGSPSSEFTVKASVTALRYVTDASPQYPRMVAEVWFRSPADAERVGFRPLS